MKMAEGSQYRQVSSSVEFDRLHIRVQDYVVWLLQIKKLTKEEAIAEAKKVYFIK